MKKGEREGGGRVRVRGWVVYSGLMRGKQYSSDDETGREKKKEKLSRSQL